MEEHEQNHVLNNLHTLICNTICNSGFLAELVSNGILGFDDVEHLVSIFKCKILFQSFDLRPKLAAYFIQL